MRPTFNGSTAIQRFECSDVVEICNGTMFDFYLVLPHLKVAVYSDHGIILSTHVFNSRIGVRLVIQVYMYMSGQLALHVYVCVESYKLDRYWEGIVGILSSLTEFVLIHLKLCFRCKHFQLLWRS